jgi:hypothetical protein
MDEILKSAEIKPKSSNVEYAIPFDIVHLPSAGLLYKDGPLAGKDSVEVHYLTAIQEDILTSPNLLQSGKMLDTLLSSVLKDKAIEPSQLTLGDRNAIIIWLRSTGYGADYPVQLRCGSCGNEHVNEFDIGALSVRELEDAPDADGLFSFELPASKAKIKFRFLTSSDEMNVLKRVEAIQKQQGSSVNHTMSLNMMASIVVVDGEQDQMLIKRFVEGMRVQDARAYRDHINSIEPGILMEQDAECPACGNVSQEVIPIRGNFFWPDSGV